MSYARNARKQVSKEEAIKAGVCIGVDIDNASLGSIKSAFKKEAFKCHPDRNPQNVVWAAERFKNVMSSYQVLVDYYGGMKKPRPERKAPDLNRMKLIIEDIVKNQNWNELKRYMKGIWEKNPKLAGFTLSLLEQGVDALVKDRQIEILRYVFLDTASEEVTKRTLPLFIRMRDFGTISEAVSRSAQNGRWNKILQCSRASWDIRKHSVSVLEEHASLLRAETDADAMFFIYKNTYSEPLGKQMLDDLVEADYPQAVAIMLRRKASQKDWGWIMSAIERLQPDQTNLRKLALLLLERDYRSVCRTADYQTLHYLCRNTSSSKIRQTVLGVIARPEIQHDVRRIMDRMKKNGRWHEIRECAEGRHHRNPDLQQYSFSLLEQHVHEIASNGDAKTVEYLWQNTPDSENRFIIMRILADQEHTRRAIKLLKSMARRKQIYWMEHFKRLAAWNPKLSRKADSLIEKANKPKKGFLWWGRAEAPSEAYAEAASEAY